MKKEDVFSEEFLKQFKTGEDLFSFLSQVQKRGVKAILEGVLDKHQNSNGENSRNGISKKKLRNQYGELEIKVPRDRES